MENKIIKLENCAIINVNNERSLFGHVVKDHRHDPISTKFAPGHRLVTSEIQKENGNIFNTRNSIYEALNFIDIAPETLSDLKKMYGNVEIISQ